MEQVPYPVGSATGKVVDNLVEARVTAFARTTGKVLDLPNRFPHSIHEMVELFTFGGKVRIPMHKAVGFARAMRNFMCACDERRLTAYENQSWFDFVGAEPG